MSNLPLNKIICGNTLTELKKFPDDSIDFVMFSPPYYGLRNYQVEGQIGLEPTFAEFLDKIIEIMKEVKRVLKPTGQIWVNFGDCYASSGSEKTRFWHGENQGKHKLSNDTYAGRARTKNYPAKCLLLLPERFAIRCVDELGLILRNKIKWAKCVMIKKDNTIIGEPMKLRQDLSQKEKEYVVKELVKHNLI